MSTERNMYERYKLYLNGNAYIPLQDLVAYEKAYHLLKEQMNQNYFPEDSTTYINHIRCCIELGKEKEASDTLFKAIKQFPNNVRLLSLLALSYSENGQEEKAIEITEQLFNVLDQTEEKRDTDIV